jgi:menaquinone-dependent protoporphyrinogen IX oxidase
MKSLVVYYSLTGKTRLVSRVMADALNAKSVEIKETRPRKGGFSVYVMGGFGAFMNKGSKIKPVDINLKQFDRIFIGSPNWASRPAPAVNAFIYNAGFDGRSVIPFFTMGGNNAEKALANVRAKIEKSGGKVAGSFAITTNKLSDKEIVARAREAAKAYSG